jgi:3-oxoadipate enol-lactonase
MPYLKVRDDIQIYYETVGEGEPLVFIHGLGASSSMYKPQVEYFKEFYKVILIDLRGNGNSGKLDSNSKSVLDIQTTDVKEVLEFLRIDSAIFVGVSYGGVVIQKIAITYPELVKGLIITDSFCDTSIDSFTKLLAVVGAKQTWILQMPQKWLAKLTKSSYKKWKLASEEMENVMLNMRKYETIIQRKAINKIKFNDDLYKVKVPTLCLVGDHTKLGVQMMKRVSSCLQDAERQTIKNSFDPSNLCQPEVFNKLVHDFISGTKGQDEGTEKVYFVKSMC